MKPSRAAPIGGAQAPAVVDASSIQRHWSSPAAFMGPRPTGASSAADSRSRPPGRTVIERIADLQPAGHPSPRPQHRTRRRYPIPHRRRIPASLTTTRRPSISRSSSCASLLLTNDSTAPRPTRLGRKRIKPANRSGKYACVLAMHLSMVMKIRASASTLAISSSSSSNFSTTRGSAQGEAARLSMSSAKGGVAVVRDTRSIR